MSNEERTWQWKGDWFIVNERQVNPIDGKWWVCRQRRGATSLQFGPFQLATAEDIKDALEREVADLKHELEMARVHQNEIRAGTWTKEELRSLGWLSSDGVADLRALVDELRDYADHGLTCPAQAGWEKPGPCSCGLVDVLLKAEQGRSGG